MYFFNLNLLLIHVSADEMRTLYVFCDISFLTLSVPFDAENIKLRTEEV